MYHYYHADSYIFLIQCSNRIICEDGYLRKIIFKYLQLKLNSNFFHNNLHIIFIFLFFNFVNLLLILLSLCFIYFYYLSTNYDSLLNS